MCEMINSSRQVLRTMNVFRFRLFRALLGLVAFTFISHSVYINIQHVQPTYMEKMKRTLEGTCTSGLKGLAKNRTGTEERILVNKEHNLAYCNVPKVGSSYWYAAFAILEGNINSSKSPGDVLVENIHFKVKVNTYDDMSSKVKQNFLDNGYMFLFVRNPYHRILSAYVNKFLSPNQYYWSAFGRQIVSKVRFKPSSKSKQCGHDVTFAEYLRYLTNNSESDHHWAPLYTLCSPCHYPYKFIGKVETFGQHTKAVIKNANISHLLIYDSNADHQVKKYMYSRIADFVKYYNILKRCVDFADTMRRLWDYFKFKGFIKYDSIPPAVPIEKYGKDTDALKADILAIAYSSYTDNIGTAQISSFGEQFVRDAYRRVSAEVLNKIKEVYLPDFLLFDYDPEPKEFFGKNTTNS